MPEIIFLFNILIFAKDNRMHKTNYRHTITIDDKTYQLLRSKGNFGETYSEVISRLIECGANHDPNS